jgi:hypothetical protein
MTYRMPEEGTTMVFASPSTVVHSILQASGVSILCFAGRKINPFDQSQSIFRISRGRYVTPIGRREHRSSVMASARGREGCNAAPDDYVANITCRFTETHAYCKIVD